MRQDMGFSDGAAFSPVPLVLTTSDYRDPNSRLTFIQYAADVVALVVSSFLYSGVGKKNLKFSRVLSI